MCCAGSCAGPCATRYLLGAGEPLMHRLVPTRDWRRRWATPIPICAAPSQLIVETLRAEEERFHRTLGRGLGPARRSHGGAVERRRHPVRRDGVQALRHLRLPARPHPGRRARQGSVGRHRRLRRRHGSPARPGPRGLDRIRAVGPGGRLAGRARPPGSDRLHRP